MTCFWDGIFASIDQQMYYDVMRHNKTNIYDMVSDLKKKNKYTFNVIWNGYRLTLKQLRENKEAIESYDQNEMRRGYYCSSCEPFLLLIIEIFKVDIMHDYNGNIMKYKYMGKSIKLLKYASSSNHFWVTH